MSVVVADAGPLIIFGRTCGIGILQSVARQVLVPPAVLRECLADAGKPGAVAVRDAVTAGLLTPILEPIQYVDEPAYLAILDDGEREAILAAKENRCAVLIDEKRGRAAARRLGLVPTGSLGVLVAAKQKAVLAQVGPIVREWRQAGYFLDDKIVFAVLAAAGETTLNPGTQ